MRRLICAMLRCSVFGQRPPLNKKYLWWRPWIHCHRSLDWRHREDTSFNKLIQVWRFIKKRYLPCKDFCCPSKEPSLFVITWCSGNFRRSCAALSFRTCDLKVVVAGMLGMSKRSGWLGDLLLADPTSGRGFVTYLELNLKTKSDLRRLALKLSCITVSLCRVWVDWVDFPTLRWWDEEKLMMLRCHRRWSVSSFWEESKPRVDGWLQFYIRFRGVLVPRNVHTRITKPWTMDKTTWHICWVAFCQNAVFCSL